MFQKSRPYRSEKYRRFTASFPCFACGVEGYSQCAHEEYGKGRGTKTDDRRSFPLCCTRLGVIGCHVQHTMLIDMTREERRDIEAAYVDRMRAIAKAAGWEIFE